MNKPVIKCPQCGEDYIRVTEYYKQEKVYIAGPTLAYNGLYPDHDVNDFRESEYYQNLRLECMNKSCGHVWTDEWRKQAHETRLEHPK